MLDTLVDVIGHQIAVRSARVVSTDMLASSNIVQVYSQELGSVNALAGWMTWLLPDDVVFVAQPNNAEKYTPYFCIGFAGRPGGMREHFIVYDHRVVPSTANLPQRPRLGHLINVGGTQSADGTISGGVWHIYTRSGWSPLAGASQTATIAYMGQIIVNPPIRLPRNEWLRLSVKHLNPRQGITTPHLPARRGRRRRCGGVKHLNPRQGITTANRVPPDSSHPSSV